MMIALLLNFSKQGMQSVDNMPDIPGYLINIVVSLPVAGLVWWIMWQWVKDLQASLANLQDKHDALTKARVDDLKSSLVVLHSVEKTNASLVDSLQKVAVQVPENTRLVLEPTMSGISNELKTVSDTAKRIEGSLPK